MNRLTARITLALLGLPATHFSAKQFGLITYEILPDNNVVITDYPEDATRELGTSDVLS